MNQFWFCLSCYWAGMYDPTPTPVCRMCRKGGRGAVVMTRFPNQDAAETVFLLAGHRGLRDMAACLRRDAEPG